MAPRDVLIATFASVTGCADLRYCSRGLKVRARTRETRIKDDDGDAMVFEFNDDATTRARRESARTRTLTNAATIRLQTGV